MSSPAYFPRVLRRRRSLSSTAGLTLIECIVAIIMIGLSAAAVTPALVIAAATRVQSQKAEQAIQLAQGEIDRVRLLLEQGQFTVADLPPAAAGNETLEALRDVGAPTSVQENSASFPNGVLVARSVDVGGNPGDDFIIQTWRSRGVQRSLADETVPVFFNIGVRVYDRQAFDSNAPGTLATDAPGSLGVVGGQGQRTTRPLAVIYASLGKGDMNSSLCDYFSITGATAAQTPPTCSLILPPSDDADDADTNGD